MNSYSQNSVLDLSISSAQTLFTFEFFMKFHYQQNWSAKFGLLRYKYHYHTYSNKINARRDQRWLEERHICMAIMRNRKALFRPTQKSFSCHAFGWEAVSVAKTKPYREIDAVDETYWDPWSRTRVIMSHHMNTTSTQWLPDLVELRLHHLLSIKWHGPKIFYWKPLMSP